MKPALQPERPFARTSQQRFAAGRPANLRRQNEGIVRVSDAPFSPGDDFCSVWHFFDLIPEGAAGWQPKYKYA
jgi:hypothetical protein